MVKFPNPADINAIALGTMTELEGIYRKGFHHAKTGKKVMDIAFRALIQNESFLKRTVGIAVFDGDAGWD